MFEKYANAIFLKKINQQESITTDNVDFESFLPLAHFFRRKESRRHPWMSIRMGSLMGGLAQQTHWPQLSKRGHRQQLGALTQHLT